jgi:hypothetical protein
VCLKVNTHQAEMGDTIRAFAVFQFNRHFSENSKDRELRQKQQNMIPAIRHLHQVYQPQRRFRRGVSGRQKADFWKMDESTKVSSTLLEFGQSVQAAGAAAEESGDGMQPLPEGEVGGGRGKMDVGEVKSTSRRTIPNLLILQINGK